MTTDVANVQDAFFTLTAGQKEDFINKIREIHIITDQDYFYTADKVLGIRYKDVFYSEILIAIMVGLIQPQTI